MSSTPVKTKTDSNYFKSKGQSPSPVTIFLMEQKIKFSSSLFLQKFEKV